MAARPNALLRAAATAAGLAAGIQAAHAVVQDYQVLRLLSYRSECTATTLSLVQEAAPLRYHAKCSNTAIYPSGVDVECADREDERSCRVLTKPRHFNFKMMAPQLSK